MNAFDKAYDFMKGNASNQLSIYCFAENTDIVTAIQNSISVVNPTFISLCNAAQIEKANTLIKDIADKITESLIKLDWVKPWNMAMYVRDILEDLYVGYLISDSNNWDISLKEDAYFQIPEVIHVLPKKAEMFATDFTTIRANCRNPIRPDCVGIASALFLLAGGIYNPQNVKLSMKVGLPSLEGKDCDNPPLVGHVETFINGAGVVNNMEESCLQYKLL